MSQFRQKIYCKQCNQLHMNDAPCAGMPKQAQASIPAMVGKVVQASTSKHPSPGTDKGRMKGGIARREKLSPTRRREIAQKAAQARWSKS